ncbi:SusC/RagA family TonB-linked outer membrane protein [Chitinophaga arvensicola]|uniref:TonB-linked outer membrane protein, SusC/RagA family n=1 Tax=Chitinophaga arvensicola TaxID=29529 RepID=A0A1I0S9A6_9BACT|nr:SusC/RagA family TonB-linked outer membrane protein [Chitinophaga arvensicola]SEW52748.1 TonB-linked outer membrane protein, SusC/RagA family [Chitinophaga arvensicola]
MATKLNGSFPFSIFRYGIFLLMSLSCLYAVASNSYRQVIPVSGVVTNETGEPIPGVSVVEKGTANGKMTDEKGAFALTVSGTESILAFSYMGYVTQEVKVGDKKVFNIKLAANQKDLGEVVITAYGKVKKSSLTDAVFAINAEKLANRPMRTLSDGLVGLAPGLNIRMSSGAPESSPSINIRGFTSFGSSASPLILVDGVERPISDVDPNDVENISLLKDGASTAIYGSRAPYGILLITTKSGKNGKLSVNYSTNIKVGKMALFPTQPESPEWARYINIAQRNGQPNGTGTDGVDAITIARMEAWLKKDWSNPAFDDLRAQFGDKAQSYIENGQFPTSDAGFKNWTREQSFATNKLYDAYFNKSAVSQQHNIGFSGGSDKLQFISGFGYNATNGLFKGDFNYNKRYNFHTKLNFKATDWLELRSDVSYVNQQNQSPNYMARNGSDVQSGTIADYGSIFGSMMQYFATPMRVPSGNQYSWILGAAGILGDGGLFTNQRNDLVLTGGATLKPLKNLEINGDYTWRVSNNDNTRVDKIAYTELPNGTKIQNNRSANVSSIAKTMGKLDYKYARFSAQYRYTLAKEHNFFVQAGMQAEETGYKSLTGSRTDLFSQDNIQALNGAANNQLANDNLYDWSVLGYYGVFSYDFREKYFVKFAGRRDASSRFSADSRWGMFPSVSAAWNVAKESFWPAKQYVSEFKPRFSWSTSGDVASNGASSYYTYLPTLAFGVNQNTLLGGNYANYATAPGLVSSTLTWAKPAVIDFGFDLSALRSRLTLSYDWYQRTVLDQVGPPNPLPATLGTAAPSLNNAVSETRGWEITIGWNDQVPVAGKPLFYDLKLNMSDYIGYVTKYSANKSGVTSGIWTPGELFGQNYAYDVNKIAQNKGDLDGGTLSNTFNYPGYLMYRDYNGDGYINSGNGGFWYSRGDLVKNGFNYPRKSFSILPTVSWNNITLSAVLEGVLQWRVYNSSEWVWGTRAGSDLAYFYTPAFKESTSLGYWNTDNKNAFFPAFNTGSSLATTQYTLNLAHLRIRNVTIGYDLPKSLIERVKLKRANLYVSGDNLGFIFNKSYIKYDPELLSSGVNGYPPLRYYSVGLNVSL